MVEFIKTHQLNIMLFMSGICGILALLSCFSRVLTLKRRRILTILETAGMILLIADWYAYRFRGDPGQLGYVMVRVCNFLVFFMTLIMTHELTLYLSDFLRDEGKMSSPPRLLRLCEVLYTAGVVLLIVSQFTGLYYYFDETNTYHRGPGNIVCFIIPILIAVIQLSTLIRYRRKISPLIVAALLINLIVPLVASAVQAFIYGVSLVNITMVGVAIILYILALADMNRAVVRSREMEAEFYRKEKALDRSRFEQTAEALASAIDAKDKYTHGHSSRVAAYSRKIAQECGKSEEDCDQIYFAALLHDVGKIGIADTIINKEGRLTDEEYAVIQRHPVYSYQILSKIGASPYLSIGGRYHHERYDGKGYPDGLIGESIPEIARIIAVADAYDAMTSNRSYRRAIPQQKVREELVKGLGTQFDPVFAKTMIHLIDVDTEYRMKELENGTDPSFSTGIVCEDLYHTCSAGILMNDRPSRIHLVCSPLRADGDRPCMPAAVLFDSLDAVVADTEEKRQDLLYYEYAVIHFDGRVTADGVRRAVSRLVTDGSEKGNDAQAVPADSLEYDLEAVRVRDHVQIRISDGARTRETVLALPDNTRFAYLAFTGENCLIRDIRIEEDASAVPEDYITRIAEEISYIKGCPEGDLPNLQVDGWRAAFTPGIPVTDSVQITFRTKSLPSARLVWHCPFVCLFTSADRKVNGAGYRELALIRLDGENWHTDDRVVNDTIVVMTPAFPGWDEWKRCLKAGISCGITLTRKENRVILQTENLGISIRSEITVRGFSGEICAALTGDQCTITEIHIAK